MITALELKNWRTHHQSTLDFEAGTNLIIGIMGSGKSSVVNGLSYGLFGTFPQLKSKQISLKEIIMNKPNKQEICEVKIKFTHKNKNYRVERILKDEGTNEAKLFEEDKLIAGPKQKDVNEKVEQILELNYELFSRAVYAEQNEMDFFLKLSPSDRKKKFDELLELQKYETVRKNTIFLKNQMEKENKQKKEYFLQQQKIINETEEEKIEENLLKINNEIKELEISKLSVDQTLNFAQKEYLTIEEIQKKYNKKNIEIEILNSKIKTLKKSLENSQKIDFENINIKKIEFAKKNEFKKNEITQVELKLKDIEKNRNQISEKKSVTNYKLKEIEKERNEILSLSKTCPTCKQKLDENHKTNLINELDTQEKLTNDENLKLDESLDKIEKEIDLLKETILKLKKEIEELTKNIFEINETEKEFLRNQKTLEEIKQSELVVVQKEKELVQFKFDEKELNSKRDFFFEMKNSFNLINEKILSKKQLKENLEFTLNKLKKIKENLNLIEKEIKQSEIVSKKLGVFENCLISTQTELREELLGTVNLAMSNVWQQIYPYADYLDVKLKVVENGYDLWVQTRNNDWVRVEGILSGGERSAAALCIRIAFSLVLTKQLSILILDEPTHNLDHNAIEKLSTMLREDLPKLVEQIFVITHEKELESAASSKIYLLNRNKDIDEVTKIEEISNK